MVSPYQQTVTLQYFSELDLVGSILKEEGHTRLQLPSSQWTRTGILCTGTACVTVYPGDEQKPYDTLVGELDLGEPATAFEVVQYLRGTQDSGTREIKRLHAGDQFYYIYGIPRNHSTYLLFLHEKEPAVVQFPSWYLKYCVFDTMTVNDLILGNAFDTAKFIPALITRSYYECPYYRHNGSAGYDAHTGKCVGELQQEWDKIDSLASLPQNIASAVSDGIFSIHALRGVDLYCVSLEFANLRYFEHYSRSGVSEVLSSAARFNEDTTRQIEECLKEGTLTCIEKED